MRKLIKNMRKLKLSVPYYLQVTPKKMKRQGINQTKHVPRGRCKY